MSGKLFVDVDGLGAVSLSTLVERTTLRLQSYAVGVVTLYRSPWLLSSLNHVAAHVEGGVVRPRLRARFSGRVVLANLGVDRVSCHFIGRLAHAVAVEALVQYFALVREVTRSWLVGRR